jgi:hypothetical protein
MHRISRKGISQLPRPIPTFLALYFGENIAYDPTARLRSAAAIEFQRRRHFPK